MTPATDRDLKCRAAHVVDKDDRSRILLLAECDASRLRYAPSAFSLANVDLVRRESALTLLLSCILCLAASQFPPSMMAATVLGKRTRGAVDTEGKPLEALLRSFPISILTHLFAALPVRTASKRRTIAPRVHREVAAPASPRRTRSTAKVAGQPPDQENGEVNGKVSDKAPSKHTLRDEKGGSPTKINSHFRTSKLVEGKPREAEG